jgi:hypothetical protein
MFAMSTTQVIGYAHFFQCGILLCNLFYPRFVYLYVHGKYRINYEMLTLILQIGQMFIILLLLRMIILQNLYTLTCT